ncbi:MAG: hypothetical protein R3F17_07490 [Planctomycetota bacterium]
MVFDIGGGSFPEIIVGRKFKVAEGSQRPSDAFTTANVSSATAPSPQRHSSAPSPPPALEIEPITRRSASISGKQCVGASGTILAVASIMDALRGRQGR